MTAAMTSKLRLCLPPAQSRVSFIRRVDRPMRLTEVIAPLEGAIHSAQCREVCTRMTQDTVLPERIEALHMRVTADLAWGESAAAARPAANPVA